MIKVSKLMAEQIRQKHLQAEYNRVEKELNRLIPMVNEANLAAEELERNIKFSTKLQKRLDPFGQQTSGRTDILIKVENKEEEYQYEWAIEKFENRLYMIRDVLEEYFEEDELPNLDKDEDPFWDPPNPILIGQSFLQFEPLSLMFENHLEAAILSIDGHAGKQGKITVGYAPCTVNGETEEELIPERLLVDKAEELIGQTDMYFKVYIRSAVDLPKNLCCNPFVTYQFKFERESLFTTDEIVGTS